MLPCAHFMFLSYCRRWLSQTQTPRRAREISFFGYGHKVAHVAKFPESVLTLLVRRLLNYILIKLRPAGGAESREWMRRRLSKRGEDLFRRHIC